MGTSVRGSLLETTVEGTVMGTIGRLDLALVFINRAVIHGNVLFTKHVDVY